MIIKNKYELTEKISEGTFGTVYKGRKLKNDSNVAIKINKSNVNFLKQECTIMHYLLSKKCVAVPEIYYYGLINDYYAVVMKYCELSLTTFAKTYENSPKIIENLFIQCIELMREFHEHMVIHCDIKPDNIMVSDNKLYFIDFGLSQFYIEEEDIQTERKTQITGTPRYVSPFIHQGYNYTPKDDIISLCYVFYELYNPLPWNSNGFVNNIQHEKNKEMCLLKIRCAKGVHTNSVGLTHIMNILKYCYTLPKDKNIDYDALIQQL